MIARVVNDVFGALRVVAKERYGTDAVMLYDGRFDGAEPESVKVSKLIFFVDVEGVDLVQPKLNADEVDVTELVMSMNIIAANRSLVYPSQTERDLLDMLIGVAHSLKRLKFVDVRLIKIGRIENVIKTDNYSVARLPIEFTINIREVEL